MPGRLRDKVCIITGTGSGIGRAAALVFAREGALIVGCDTNPSLAAETADLVGAAGGRMRTLQPCDLTDPAQCRKLVEIAIEEFGRIDVLYNNAAMAYFNPIEAITVEEWRANMSQEVDLVFYMTQAAWPHLKCSRGVIVNSASIMAWRVFQHIPALAHTTAKAGIVAMTRQLAMEGREYGIRANSLSPGIIETGQTRDQLANDDWKKSQIAETLLGRVGRPEEVANAALFLASEESSYVTGIDLLVDGGVSV